MASLISKASLLMVPSVYEDGTLYNVLPSGNKAPDETGSHNGYDQTRADFTFSRGSNLAATRVNSDGLIEKGRENLLLQSNQFNTTWVNSNSSETSGQEGYDGTNDAWKLTASSAGFAYLQQSNTNTGIQTFSVYAKAGTADFLQVYITGTDSSHYFDLTNGTASTPTGAGAVDSSIQDIGDGWYRCSCVCNGTNATLRLYIRQGVNVNPSSGEYIFIQSAQLEKGLVSTPYIATGSTTAQAGILEDMPRINYDANGENGALLLEPSRTNKLPYSEYIGAGDWTKQRVDVTTNTSDTKSPEGVYNAAKFVSNNASESYVNDSISITGTKATLSFYAKKGDLDFCHSLAWDTSQGGCRQWFDLVNGTTGTTTTFGSSYSVDSASIEDAGNGWFRCITVFNVLAGNNGFRMNPSQADGNINSPVNAYGYFYGAQVEDGASYPSSYVPTYGSAVTRSADSCSVTGVSDVIGQSEGTAYVEVMYNNGGDAGVDASFFGLKNSAGTTYLNIYRLNSTLAFRFFNAGANQFFHTETPTNETLLKIAFAYKANDFALYINGVQEATDTSGSVAGMSEVHLAGFSVGDNLTDNYKTILFKERLSNSELADLTA